MKPSSGLLDEECAELQARGLDGAASRKHWQ